MGLPEISVSFIRKARTLVKRSSRGMVLLILKDKTKEQPLTPYESMEDVQEGDWTAPNYDYIKMVMLGAPRAVVAVRAAASEDGTVNIEDTIRLIDTLNFDWLAYPECTEPDALRTVEYIKAARKAQKKVKAVLPDTEADHEGIVNFVMQNISVAWEGSKNVVTYTTAGYTARIAGILAGLSLSVSSTYFVLDEIVDLTRTASADGAIEDGKLVIIYDGEKFKIGRGVTSLTTVTEEKPDDFRKIKIVEGADLIKTDIRTTYEDDFVGKLPNTYDNKQMFVGAVNEYFDGLAGTVLNGSQDNYIEVDVAANEQYLKDRDMDTGGLSVQELKEANTGSCFFACGKVSMLDAMEDLKLELSM